MLGKFFKKDCIILKRKESDIQGIAALMTPPDNLVGYTRTNHRRCKICMNIWSKNRIKERYHSEPLYRQNLLEYNRQQRAKKSEMKYARDLLEVEVVV